MEKEKFHLKPFCLTSLGVLSCSEKRKSWLYWTQFHSSVLLLMNTHSCFVFCTNVYVCAQGTGRFPLTKWNTVPASGQTLWILAISIFQQGRLRLWIYLSVDLGVFSTLAAWGCMSDAAARPQSVSALTGIPGTSGTSLVDPVNFATFSPESGIYQRNGACPCPGFQLVDDADGCKSYFYSADGFLFRRLQRAFLSSKLHESAIQLTRI